jgi:pimeloyl-ACP methyl ester carboxylesterase
VVRRFQVADGDKLSPHRRTGRTLTREGTASYILPTRMKPFSRTLPAILTGLSIGVLLASCPSPALGAEPAGPLAAAAHHTVAVGTNKVHYLTLGKGKSTIVFVHCWAGHAGFWREQVPALADQARLILVDLPGHGQSDKPQAAYTMPFFARAVIGVLEDAKVDKAVLVGHSMGVAVICQVWKQAPEKVSALCAIDGLLRQPSLAAGQAEEFIGPFRSAGYREHAAAFIRSMFPIAGTEAVRDRTVADMLETPRHVMLGAMEGMFGAGQPAWDLQKVAVPLVVINATNPMWTADYEAYVRGLSERVSYRTISGVGHWLMLEKPAEFNAALLEEFTKYGLINK